MFLVKEPIIHDGNFNWFNADVLFARSQEWNKFMMEFLMEI